MDTYSWLRELADSWVLLAMVVFYLSACLWAMSPWRKAANAEAASIIMNDDAPRPDPNAAPNLSKSGCKSNCAGCTCGKLNLEADHV